MAFLASSVDVVAPGGVWEWFIINVFGFIANYGWRIVVFVILLKLLLSPLDFYQRYKMRKNQRITEQLKPQMEKIEKQYGNDKAALQRKQMELNKSAGFSYMSACIPLIVTFVLFITFFTALRSVSTYMEFRQYVEMYDSYVTSYEETGFNFITRNEEDRTGGRFALSDANVNYRDIDTWLEGVFENEDSLNAAISSEIIVEDFKNNDITNPKETLLRYKTEFISNGKSYKDFVAKYKGKSADFDTKDNELPVAMSILLQVKAQESTVEAFKNRRTSFLWIKSIWVADVPWANSVPDWDSFQSTMKSVNNYHYLDWDTNPGKVYTDNQSLFNNMANGETYNIVTDKIRKDESLYQTNGYLVLVILVIGLSFLSQFISNLQQKKSGQATQGGGMGMMKVMMWIMPIMFAVFALTSSSAFTLYMVVNSIMSLVINLITSLIVNKIFGSPKKGGETIVKYGRADPNERINERKNLSDRRKNK